MSSQTKPTEIIIPDFFPQCNNLELHSNPNVKEATLRSQQWIFEHGNLSESRKNEFDGIKAGELTSMCYPTADLDSLTLCTDFMNYIFHIDDLSDDMNKTGTTGIASEVMNTLNNPSSYQPTTRIGRMTADYWKRLIKTASPAMQRRFITTFGEFLKGVTTQAVDRHSGAVPDLESYIALRRDTSACLPSWALIEYVNNLDIPDEVMEHKIIQSLNSSVTDYVAWCNDIFSYNCEQSKGDTHNMVSVVMSERELDLQSAIDFVGDMCKKAYDQVMENKEMLPSWGPEVDSQVKIYVDGLIEWLVGSLHWSFETERYFGRKGSEVKVTRRVHLL